MSRKQIIIDISPEGEINIDMKNFKGKVCEEVLDNLTIDDKKTTLKSDYYDKNDTVKIIS